MQKLPHTTVEFYIAIVITLLTVAFPMTWWLRAMLFFTIAGIVTDLIFRAPITAGWSKLKKIWACCIAFILLAAIGWKPIKGDYVGTELPDITLRFVHPKHPALQIQNTSGKVANNVKYMVTLWNLAAVNEINPMPIPTATFDFVRPHSFGGPMNVFERVVSTLKPGNHLVGSASISCPDCVRGRTFFVYIIWDQGGWYSEVEDMTTGQVIFPKFRPTTMDAFADQILSAVPASKRIRIE